MPGPSAQPPTRVRRARIGVGVLFFTNGALFSNLLPRYPEIKTDLELTNAAFGFAVAAFPLGALIAGLTAVAAQLAIPLSAHLTVSAVLFSLMALVSYRLLLDGPEPSEVTPFLAPRNSRPKAAGLTMGSLAKYAVVAALVMIAASGAVVEDAGSSWSAIYLSNFLGASAFVAGLGFIALQGMQFVGRIFGDRLVDHFGQRAVARTGGVIVFVGMGVALIFPTIVGTVIGLGLAGLGVATLIPAAMHAANELPGFKPGTGLTIASWLLRAGFLLSPPLVGAIADASSLRFGLLIVPAAGLLVVLFSPVLAKVVQQPRSTRAPDPELHPAADDLKDQAHPRA